jgi:hypothetical protein
MKKLLSSFCYRHTALKTNDRYVFLARPGFELFSSAVAGMARVRGPSISTNIVAKAATLNALLAAVVMGEAQRL